ncbi:N-acetylglutamate synthase-like GNAT family acetyltransferase [Mesorhizobium robiniae]|uniref:N-acetylglutamate synthase-like GNAT family acetyltransferase n=1 Tax=Mesorhizobium robiniae TaxID=559315 RepID=A0ABV2GRW6_9HYPH
MDGYDERHPDDRLASNHPLLLMHEGTPVGTARLDVTGPRLGVVRLVAIEANLQRRGLGRLLMQEVESYARRVGLEQLEVNAAKEAEGFYQSLGWVAVRSDRENPLMTKSLSPGEIQ